MDCANSTLQVNTHYSNGLDISENATIVEEGLRVCPLCQSEIKLFFINLNEKLLMCENAECEYPFGYEDLQFFKEDSTADGEEEVCSIGSKRTTENTSATCSIMSGAAWSEIACMTRVCESDDSQFEFIPKTSKKKPDREKAEKVLSNIKSIEGLNLELKEIDGCTKRRLANKKYIKNLMTLQTISGEKILKPEEMLVLNKDLNVGKVKIDVNTNTESSMSCIKIELVDITNLAKPVVSDHNESNNNNS